MAYISEYWENKEARMSKAMYQTEDAEKRFRQYIEKCVQDTKLYGTTYKFTPNSVCKNMEIIVCDSDTVNAAFYYKNGRTALLNFSSYKNPGGMFLNGSKAQEECLCHTSFLYNVLARFDETFYAWNRNHKNKALYLNRSLYSPNVLFFGKDYFEYFDVITCAAPNKSAAQKYQNVSDKENLAALASRIHFVLDVARENRVNTLILGAYGCGVFGQNAIEVANIFKQYLNTTHKCFDRVVFAIPRGRDGNLEKFYTVFHQ